jgi:hypothetical protein
MRDPGFKIHSTHLRSRNSHLESHYSHPESRNPHHVSRIMHYKSRISDHESRILSSHPAARPPISKRASRINPHYLGYINVTVKRIPQLGPFDGRSA